MLFNIVDRYMSLCINPVQYKNASIIPLAVFDV